MLVVGLVALVWTVTRGGGHDYTVVFSDAGQLVKGDVVRIGGTAAGSVTGIDLTDSNQAAVHIEVDDSFAPLRAGTTATIRAQGLVGVASRYVDISPAPTFHAALPDGATIGADQTQSIVEVDQLFDTLDPKTRQGLARFIKGSADWYQGREQQANLSALYFPPALEQSSRLFSELDSSSPTFDRFLVNAGQALHALTARRQLTDLVTQTRGAVHALSSNTRALSTALVNLPPALRTGTQAFRALRPALGDLRHLVDVSGTSTKNLAPFLRRLRPVLGEADPVFAQLASMFDKPGPNNDVYEALLDLPPLAKTIASDFPHAEQALQQSTPVFEFARPYIPDTVGWVRNFAGVFAPYDANGHYARTVPIFDAFNFVDDSQGGHLDPKAPSARGTSPYLKGGMLRRCPGAATRRAPDGSGPWVDNGPLANPDCDPSQVIGG